MYKLLASNRETFSSPGEFPFKLKINQGPEQGEFFGVIRCEFETNAHPENRAIQQELTQTFLDSGILRVDDAEYTKFSKSIFTTLVAYTCPDDTRQFVKDVSTHVAWLFCLDNKVDEPSSPFRENAKLLEELNSKFLDAIRLSFLSSSARLSFDLPQELQLYLPLIDLNKRVGDTLRGKDTTYFLASHREYFQAITNESKNRREGKWRSRDGYTELRKYTSAVREVLEYIWALKGLTLSSEVRDNINFQSMVNSSNLFVSYVNDLFSLNNEIKEGTRENIVRVIEHHRKCSLKEAIEETITLINEAMQEFIESKAMFSQNTLPARDRVIADMALKYAESLMIANLKWSKETGRYKEAEI